MVPNRTGDRPFHGLRPPAHGLVAVMRCRPACQFRHVFPFRQQASESPLPKPGLAQQRMATDLRLHRATEALCARAPALLGFYIARLIDLIPGVDPDALLNDLLHDAAALDSNIEAFGQFPPPPIDLAPDPEPEPEGGAP